MEIITQRLKLMGKVPLRFGIYHNDLNIGYIRAYLEDSFYDYNCEYSIKPEFEGNGFATEALIAFNKYVREECKRNLCMFIHEDNDKSARVATKAGFVPAGKVMLGNGPHIIYRDSRERVIDKELLEEIFKPIKIVCR